MSRQAVWIFFLVLIALVAGWFTVRSAIAINTYLRLSKEAPATIESLQISHIKGDRYGVLATYTFPLKEGSGRGAEMLSKVYPNSYAAEGALARLKRESWTVWYNPKHPEQSTLQKIFPFKVTLSAIVLIAVVLYFACLALYVNWRRS